MVQMWFCFNLFLLCLVFIIISYHNLNKRKTMGNKNWTKTITEPQHTHKGKCCRDRHISSLIWWPFYLARGFAAQTITFKETSTIKQVSEVSIISNYNINLTGVI